MKSYRLKKTNEKKEDEKTKDIGDNISNLISLKIRNENIHIKNIIRTIHYVYTNKYDSETGFSYIKDILKNIIKGNVYDIEYKKYINKNCIYELCSRILLNIIKTNVKDDNFNKIVEFLFDILYYCDIIMSEKKKVKSINTEINSNQEYELITKLWNRLLDNIFIKDKKQRINLCKVIKTLVKKACALQIDVSNKLCKKHANIFLSLLNDKDHNIRVLCLIILEPFQDFNTKGSYLKCLDDSHYIVRINAIKNISINVEDNNFDHLVILKNFLIRINDINHNVRISVYEKLKNYYFYIPSDMKFELLLCGLNDKDKLVRESCYSMIIHWIQLFDDKIENLLLHLINSDIDNDIIVEQICKIHLNNVRKGNIKSSTIEVDEDRKVFENNNNSEEKNSTYNNYDCSYNESWFNYCINNLFSLNTAELYILRVYVQHFSDEQEKEKIDALKVINTIYYYLYLSKFNEKLYYNRKNYINCIENNESDQADSQNLFCSCGKNKIDIKVLEENRKKKFIDTSIFDDTYCDKCLYYTTAKKSESHNNSNDKNETGDNNADSNIQENVLINEDNINENYNYICNIKNLLLICKYLDIIEIYQVEKILKCCETILLTGPLREVIIKCMLNNTGVNYYKLQKGHITCAYWLSNSYIYACLELLRQMIYIKNKNSDINDIEINLTNQILSIISEIKEPFDDTENDNPFLDNNINLMEDEKKLSKNIGKNEKIEKNPLTLLFNNIMNVENDTIFDIIRKKNLNTLSIEHLLILCKKMQHKLDVTEAKIKDLTEMEKEKENEKNEKNEKNETLNNVMLEKDKINKQMNETNDINAFHEQIRMHTQIFLKQITMLSLLRLELKRRWLRILFILECFLCKSKSHCSFDSALREFPNELLLPALNFCCSIMPDWDDKEIEDQFYDIIVSKCLGNWCMFISNDEELKKQIYAYKTAIADTCDVLNNCLLNIEKIHSNIYPNIYNKANIDIMTHTEKVFNKNTTCEEENKKVDNDEDINNNYIFYEYNTPNEHLLNYFSSNQDAWYEYKELLEKLEINSLRCEIYICVLGDLLMTHPNLNNDELIIDAVENLWSYLNGTINTSKYIQSICLRVCCKLLLTEYLGNHIYKLSNDELFSLMKASSSKLRALFEMCFLMSPSTYSCIQDYKKISTFNITNINSHDKIFLFSIFSMYPSMSETNLLIFHYTFEEVILKTCEGVLKYKLKTINFTNILTFMIFTLLHKANINFLVANFAKYIKWILLIIIEKGIALTNRSNIIELIYKVIQIYLFHDLSDINSLEKKRNYETREVKKRGRKRKVNPLEEKVEKKEIEKDIEKEFEKEMEKEMEKEIDKEKGEKENENDLEKEKKNYTICFKSVQTNVNTTIKDLKILFVLVNFCMHSSDIIRAKNELKYCEIMKEQIEKKIEEIKNYFVKKNFIVTENNDEKRENEENKNNDNLLDLKQIDSLTEDSIYQEIIEDYANYIGKLSSRDFSYPIIPRDLDNANEGEMSKQEILDQINNSCTYDEPENDNSQKIIRKRGRKKKNVNIENESFNDFNEKDKELQIMNEKKINKYSENNMTINENNSLKSNMENIIQNKKKQLTYENENKENKKDTEKKSDNFHNTINTKSNIKNKFTELNLSSSEETQNRDCNSSLNDYESMKNYTDLNDESSSYSSFNSNDSTAIAFKRLNKLKRTSYSSVVSKF
ncbi:conserved Plasmodium protein, unknown function [Plasmodium gallinaceum]|uniref:Merozoite organizing protein n=1 Tax=Plasmodium gallinaceum TaxID=5849 RepID=A0A1J1GWT1_PLAGA|nr:conserved Plasmodium protein, unknown function [Plasmodium gallinaceum]CRG96719.1 conserved Plasmodium protein, unknown function [Plasmodium gallinaceum]